MLSLCKSSGTISPNCELFLFDIIDYTFLAFSNSSAKNTIHVDDLGRNFALNPRQGLKISAFRDAHTPRAMADRELDDLAKYLLHVATVDDMETLNHKDWKRIVRALPPH